MLQQTQVETVIPYYYRFLEKFPTIAAVASSSLDQVLKAWEGLGYYARARNLFWASQKILKEYDGNMPKRYDEIIKIPGIGPYTAGAVASIAFDEPVPLADGNVIRVLSRVLKISEPPSKNGVKAKFLNAARECMPEDQAGDFNQALMELGALICTPQNPQCDICPVNVMCEAKRSLPDPSVLPTRVPALALLREIPISRPKVLR